MPVVKRSRRWSAAARLLELGGSNPVGGMDVCLLGVLCDRVEVSATGRSLVQRCPTERDVYECDQVKK
jgi:hypothetical protein